MGQKLLPILSYFLPLPLSLTLELQDQPSHSSAAVGRCGTGTPQSNATPAEQQPIAEACG